MGKDVPNQEATMTATATTETEKSPTATANRYIVPRWLVLTLMSGFLLLVAGIVWAIASTQVGCGFIDMAPTTDIMPGPQPCAPDATTPALVTIWLIALLLAAAFVVAFTVARRRGTVLLIIAAVMLLVAVIGGLATVVAASSVPPIIYY